MGLLSVLTRKKQDYALRPERLLRELDLRTPQDGDLLLGYLLDAQGDAESSEALSFPLGRQQYREALPGTDRGTLLLQRRPLVHIQQVLSSDDLLDAADYSIRESAMAAMLWRNGRTWQGFHRGAGFVSAGSPIEPYEYPYTVDYWAGWLWPTDELYQVTTITATASNKTYTDAAGNIPLLVPGDVVRFQGFTNANNNGVKTVVSRTDTTVVVAETVVNETPTASNPITMLCATLPRDIQRALVDQVRSYYMERRENLTGPRLIPGAEGSMRLIQSGSGLNARAQETYMNYRPIKVA